MTRAAGIAAAILLPLTLAGALVWGITRPGHHPVSAPADHRAAVAAHGPQVRYLGVSVAAPVGPGITAWTRTAGSRPGIVAYYQRFGAQFKDSPAMLIEHDGAIPLLQWNPGRVRFADITDGLYDTYLQSYATSVRAFRARIIISFAHEFNGPWWHWGHQPPADFVAAWQHIHDIFTSAGVRNVIWCWNPNVVSGPSVRDPAAWWPGARYVDWVALDGYYWRPGATFTSVFGPAITQMRELAPGKPLAIAETGVPAGPQMPAGLTDLLTGAARAGITAVVYFDHDKGQPGYKDWRITGTPAIAALRAAVTKYAGDRP